MVNACSFALAICHRRVRPMRRMLRLVYFVMGPVALALCAGQTGNSAEPAVALEPGAALRSIQVRHGFTVELMAAEPLVADPIAFEFGPDGKLWVVEMGDYPLGPSGGQIRCLEDTKGDGKYDKSTVFLDVPFPTGVLPWRKGVLVTAAPHALYPGDTARGGKGH